MPTYGGGMEIFMLYMFLANGFEETEAIGCLDVLRRAEIDVKTVGVGGKEITGSHGVCVRADVCIDEISLEGLEGVILPGGMPGTTNLQADENVINAVKHCAKQGKLIAAICAAPMILGQLGILEGRIAVCYPGFEEHLKGARVDADAFVAIDGNVITGRGAGASMLFGARIADWFKAGAGQEILDQMQHPLCENR